MIIIFINSEITSSSNFNTDVLRYTSFILGLYLLIIDELYLITE